MCFDQVIVKFAAGPRTGRQDNSHSFTLICLNSAASNSKAHTHASAHES